jgi:segregation and condensation protein A
MDVQTETAPDNRVLEAEFALPIEELAAQNGAVHSDGVAQNGVAQSENAGGEAAPDEAVQSGTTQGVEGQPQVRDPDRFTGHRVQLRLFEGPLDLLLYLIRAHRYDICDIAIADVTNQFIGFIRLMDELDLEYAGDFMVTAATLMQIKSRMLLPQHQSENEDEMEDDAKNDPRRELVDRLLEYQRYQEAADTLKDLREERAQMWTRPPISPELAEALAARSDTDVVAPPEDDGAMLLQDISTFDLLRALQKVLDRVAERPVTTIRREPFTLSERLRDVMRRIAGSDSGLTFGDLCDDCNTRLEVVITFLSVLELIARKRIVVQQETLFDEILVKARPQNP